MYFANLENKSNELLLLKSLWWREYIVIHRFSSAPLHCSRVNCAFSDKHNYKNISKVLVYFLIEIAIDFLKLYCNTYILFNRIMASLNLLRYLVIKDNESDNQVSEFFEKETVSILTIYKKCFRFLYQYPLKTVFHLLPSYRGWRKCQQLFWNLKLIPKSPYRPTPSFPFLSYCTSALSLQALLRPGR